MDKNYNIEYAPVDIGYYEYDKFSDNISLKASIVLSFR
jgi:hypothetical protein